MQDASDRRDIETLLCEACRREFYIDALIAHTEGAARCLDLWPELGTLAPGARADIALLDADPLRCDWNDLPPRACGVILGGEPRLRSGT